MISITNQLELRHVHYFLTLSNTLHFGLAAEKLHISQSALSQQIQRLEVILKQPLFKRTNRKVALTRAGELFKIEAEIIFNQMQTSINRWNLGLEGTSGLLNIGFVGSAMQVYLPKRIKVLKENHPNIKLVLQEASNKVQLDMLQRNELDLGFMRSNRVLPTMTCKKVHTENFCLVLPHSHPLSVSTFKGLGQVAHEDFILFPNEQSQMYYQQITGLCAAHGFTPKISHQSIHGPTIFKLVEDGMGISIVPKSLTHAMSYNVKCIELKNEVFQTELYAVWNPDFTNTAVPHFLKLL
ncbi:LysR family transcriptional regulator [uncultured Croceitalea sp.]|uniref:LysR family transcriptional regulator n=1 Tax=uncultured Croceitalea sp. TaxID=1798908 RepID=UPI0033062C63